MKKGRDTRAQDTTNAKIRKGVDMKRLMTAMLFAAAFSMPAVLPVAAAGNPSGTGQPSQTCLMGTALTEPGNAAAAPGSAFNEDPGGTAGAVYANPGSQGGMSSGNTHVVSQYDVACFQVSQH
jgi:hypothetical protein